MWLWILLGIAIGISAAIGFAYWWVANLFKDPYQT
jgi:hypothetical protein